MRDFSGNGGNLEQLSEIFRAAAAKSTGPGKPKFDRLYDAFSELKNLTDRRGDPPAFIVATEKFNAALGDVQAFSEKDKETREILMELSNKILDIEEGRPPRQAPAPPPQKQLPPPEEKKIEKKTPEKKRGNRHWDL